MKMMNQFKISRRNDENWQMAQKLFNSKSTMEKILGTSLFKVSKIKVILKIALSYKNISLSIALNPILITSVCFVTKTI